MSATRRPLGAAGITLCFARIGGFTPQRIFPTLVRMKPIRELARLPSPFPKPQGIHADGTTLWVSSRATRRVYALDPASLHVTWETPSPEGLVTWGLTRVGAELRAVVGGEGGPADIRSIRRCLPGQGFDPGFRWSVPEDAGSHLSHDGYHLVLSQWYPKKLLFLDQAGRVERMITVPRGIAGQCFAEGCFYLVTTDREETDEYFLTRVDPRGDEPECTDVARVPFQARGLAHDGRDFWTNHREANQIVRFAQQA